MPTANWTPLEPGTNYPHTHTHTSTASSVGECQRPVFAVRSLQLAAVLIAPPIRATNGLRLCPRADDAAVAVSVPDQPLGEESKRVSIVTTHTEHTHTWDNCDPINILFQ